MYITVTLKQIKKALKTFDKTRFYSFKAFYYSLNFDASELCAEELAEYTWRYAKETFKKPKEYRILKKTLKHNKNESLEFTLEVTENLAEFIYDYNKKWG